MQVGGWQLADRWRMFTVAGWRLSVLTSQFRRRLKRRTEELAFQFLLCGNLNDRFLIRRPEGQNFGTIEEFLTRVALPRFDVIFSYDLGNGIRIEKGGEIVT